MSVSEMHDRQAELNEWGAACVGNMRLTSQSFMLDHTMKLELSSDDLKLGDSDGGFAV